MFTPKGDVIALPVRRHAGRLRLRGAHRGRSPLRRRPGQRQAGAAGEPAGQRRRRRGASPRKAARRRPEPGLAARSSRAPRARSKIKAWFSKERREEAIENGKDAAGQGDAQAGPAAAADAVQRGARDDRARACASPDIAALYAAVGEGHASAADHRAAAGPVRSGARTPPTEDLAEATSPTRDAKRRRRPQGDPGVVVKGAERRLGQAGHAAARPCPGDAIVGLRHPRGRRLGAPQRLHQRDRAAGRPAGAHRATSSGRRRRPACSWSTSRSRRSTGRGCCPT